MKKILFLLTLAAIAAVSPLSAQNGVHNGHRYVDLGLPSGTKWADCNVGASSQSQYGNYYAWGETSPKYNCSENNYVCENFVDVASKQWGGSWRVPSKEQFEELIKYTTSGWTTINGVNGRLFTSKNGNSIFLPAVGFCKGTFLYGVRSAGLYWSRMLTADDQNRAYYLYFDGSNVYVSHYGDRYYGLTVRPVLP